MALFSVSLKHAAARLLTGVFSARRIVFPASSSLSPIRSVFPAREIGPPVSVSRPYTTTTTTWNTGGDDDDPNLPRPCVLYKDEVSRESIVGLLAPPASQIRIRGFEDLPYEATKTLLPVSKLATPASFTLAARALTSTRNVLPARRFITPPVFSQAFSADACEGKGDDNDDYEKNVHCELAFRWLQNQVRGRRDWVVTMNPRPVFYRNLIDNAACGLNEDERSFVSHCGKEGEWPEHLCKFRHPKSSMKEEEDILTYRFEVPGCTMEDFKVTVENHRLIIINLKIKESGREDDQDDDAGLMLMLLVWPCWFKPNLITTDCKLGMLTVVVPKADGKCLEEKDRWWSTAWKNVGMLINMEEIIFGAAEQGRASN